MVFIVFLVCPFCHEECTGAEVVLEYAEYTPDASGYLMPEPRTAFVLTKAHLFEYCEGSWLAYDVDSKFVIRIEKLLAKARKKGRLSIELEGLDVVALDPKIRFRGVAPHGECVAAIATVEGRSVLFMTWLWKNHSILGTIKRRFVKRATKVQVTQHVSPKPLVLYDYASTVYTMF